MLLPPCIPGITYRPDFLTTEQADWLLDYCLKSIPWQQHTLTLYGQPHQQPRLTYWMADSGVDYRYSGLYLSANPWHEPIDLLRQRLTHKQRPAFNAVLLNYYRDGNDSMGWHSDDEKSLGDCPTIASISLGTVRDFQLRGKPSGKTPSPILETFSLAHGSLLVMSGNCQRDYQHALPKRKRVTRPRINLTFRYVFPNS